MNARDSSSRTPRADQHDNTGFLESKRSAAAGPEQARGRTNAAHRNAGSHCIRPVSGLASAGALKGTEARRAFPGSVDPSGCRAARSSLTVAGAAPESRGSPPLTGFPLNPPPLIAKAGT